MRVQRAVIMAVVVWAMASGCSDDADDAGGAAPGVTTTSAVAADADPSGDPGTAVVISGFTFSPGALEVSVGDTVTWTNEDGTEHTVTDEGGAFGESLGSGDEFQFTFDEAGAYAYFCGIHPDMTGEVVVS